METHFSNAAHSTSVDPSAVHDDIHAFVNGGSYDACGFFENDIQSFDSDQGEVDFLCVVKESKSRLYAFVRKHIRSSQVVDDIVQQTLLEAYRSRDRFRGESKPETWLFGIALNIIRNSISRCPDYLYQFEDVDGVADLLVSETDIDPMSIAMRMQLMQRLQGAVDVLPESMRNVIQLVILDGCSYSDAASELNVPVGTVRSRLSRARELLKEALET